MMFLHPFPPSAGINEGFGVCTHYFHSPVIERIKRSPSKASHSFSFNLEQPSP